MDMKTCRRCGRILELSCFHRDKGLLDGHRNICKECACMASIRSRNALNAKTSGLYGVFHSMKKRCYNPSHVSYPRYGGRGIVICACWLEHPESFYSWAFANGYQRGLQIDRIDNNGSYEPNNCRFVTRAQNQQHTRRSPYTQQDVAEIRRRWDNHIEMQKDMASRWGVDPSTISDICQRKTWKEACGTCR